MKCQLKTRMSSMTYQVTICIRLTNGSDVYRSATNGHDPFLADDFKQCQEAKLLRKVAQNGNVADIRVNENRTPGKKASVASPLTMNSWPSTLVSPLDLCSSVIQWCISSGVSALQ